MVLFAFMTFRVIEKCTKKKICSVRAKQRTNLMGCDLSQLRMCPKFKKVRKKRCKPMANVKIMCVFS